MIGPGVLEPALAHLADDGFVAYPTETVWGLGACADRPRAIERLIAWKGRSAEAPMSVLVGSPEAAERLGCVLDAAARRLAEAFWPGPLTIVVACGRTFARGVGGEGGALGLRCSPHPLAHALAAAVEEAGLGPLTSTSLNRSGEPAVADLGAARALLAARAAEVEVAPLLVEAAGADAGGAAPSSVVDCTRESPRLLREGAIPRARLESVWSDAELGRVGEGAA